MFFGHINTFYVSGATTVVQSRCAGDAGTALQNVISKQQHV